MGILSKIIWPLANLEKLDFHHNVFYGNNSHSTLSSVGQYRLTGVKPVAIGKTFEELFRMTARANRVALTRIPDSCRSVGKSIVRVKSPFDFILSFNSKTALIDTKTTQGSTFPCPKICEHQISELINHEHAGAIAGYVIWLRGSNRVIFMSAVNLFGFMQTGGSFSETHPEAIFLGTNVFDTRLIFTRPSEGNWKKFSEGWTPSPNSSLFVA